MRGKRAGFGDNTSSGASMSGFDISFSAPSGPLPPPSLPFPTTISGVQFFFDGRDLTGTTGDVATSMPDSSGLLNNATPNATWNGATLDMDAFGPGLHAIEFLNKTAQFDLPAAVRTALATTGEAELWIVNGGITGARGGDGGDFGSASVGLGGRYPWNSTQVWSSFCGAVERQFGNFVGIAAPHVARWYYRSDAGQAGVETSVSGTPTLVGVQTYPFSLDTTLKIGGNYSNTYFWGGNMASVAVYDNFLSTADSGALHDWFASTWGV